MGAAKMNKPKHTCKLCGGLIVPEIDRNRLCPECLRLQRCVGRKRAGIESEIESILGYRVNTKYAE